MGVVLDGCGGLRGSNAMLVVGTYVCCLFAGGSCVVDGGRFACDDAEEDAGCFCGFVLDVAPLYGGSVFGLFLMPGIVWYGIIPPNPGGLSGGGCFGVCASDDVLEVVSLASGSTIRTGNCCG